MLQPRILAQTGEKERRAEQLLYSGEQVRLFSTQAKGCSEYAQTELQVFCIVDGFFYNHEQLCQRYGVRSGSSAAKVFVAAFLDSGADALVQFDGPFSFCLYDQRSTTLYFGRDYLGQRPLFYCCSGQQVILGSSIAQLALLKDDVIQVNHGVLAEYLLDVRSNSPETLIQDILRLRPGHYASWKDGRMQIERHWQWEKAAAEPFEPDAAAAELALVLERAVRSVPGRRAVSLSGGLDSSALAAFNGGESRPAAFSMSFVDCPGDERHYLRMVRESLEQDFFDVAYEVPDIEWLRAQSRRSLDVAVPPNSWLSHLLRRCAAQRDYDSILTGWGGDELLTGFPPPPQSNMSAFDGGRYAPVLDKLKRMLPLSRWYPSWCTSKFFKDSNIEARLRQQQQSLQEYEGSQQAVATMLWGAYILQLRDAEERESAYDGIEVAHPFYAKAVFNLLFPRTIAELQFDGRPKALLRSAVRGRLPTELLERRDKAEFSFVWLDALRGIRAEDLQLPNLTALGWVTGAKIRQEYDSLHSVSISNAEAHVQRITRLWNMLSAEAFLAAVEEFNHSRRYTSASPGVA